MSYNNFLDYSIKANIIDESLCLHTIYYTKEIRCIILKENDTYIFAFSCFCSNSFIRVLQQNYNMSQYHTLTNDCHPHFDRVSNFFSDEILKFISEYKENGINISNIIFTGISFGAAISTVTCMRISFILKTNIQLVTFGSPRIGNQHFVKYLLSNPFIKFTTFVTCCQIYDSIYQDPVCSFPPSDIYADLPNKLYISNNYLYSSLIKPPKNIDSKWTINSSLLNLIKEQTLFDSETNYLLKNLHEPCAYKIL